MKNLVIFDLDGTIFDTPKAITVSLMEVIQVNGYIAVPEQIRSLVGIPLTKIFAEVYGVNDEALISKSIKQYQEVWRRNILPVVDNIIFSGVREEILRLSNSGVLLAVATNKYHKSAMDLLVAAKLDGFFHLVIGGDQVNKTKPDPEPIQIILDQLSVDSDKAVMVGDTRHDIQSAKSANVDAVAIGHGVDSESDLRSMNPSFFARDFSELSQYLRSRFE